MVQELRIRNQSQQLYVRALSSHWRNGIQVFDPSTWLLRDPEAEEKMLRDADIAHAIGYRRALIAGRQWTLTPRKEKGPVSDLAIAVGTELLEGIKHFMDARLNLARAFFSGSRFARIHMVPRVLRIGDGKARTWLVPFRLEDMDKRMYRIVPDLDGDELTAHWERWDLVKQQWEPETIEDGVATIRHVYQDDQATTGHGRALREALGWIWYTKTHVMQETVQAVEKFAQGTIHAKVDMLRDADTGLPNSTLIQEFVDTLEDMRARHILVTDKSDDIEILQGNAEGWELLDVMERKLKSSVMTLVLGANLTTSADQGGSFALAEIQENSTEALVQYDRGTLEETLTDDLMGCVWFKNHANLVELGIAEEKPRFSITQEKRLDPKIRAEVAASLHGMGVSLSSEDLYEQTGLKKPEPGEEIIEGSTTPAGGDLFGGFGGGFGQPPPAGPANGASAPSRVSP